MHASHDKTNALKCDSECTVIANSSFHSVYAQYMLADSIHSFLRENVLISIDNALHRYIRHTELK